MKKPLMLKTIICSMALFVVLYIFLINASSGVSGDSAAYIVLGKSLSFGCGYRDICFAGKPPHNDLPFGFSFLLAPVIYFFGYNFLAMNFLIFITAVGSLYMIYLLFKYLNDESTAQIILILTALSCQFLYFSSSILPEMPYLFFSLSVLFFTEKFKHEEKWLSRNVFFIIFFATLAYFTRSIGLCLSAAVLCYLFFEIKRRQNLPLAVKKTVFAGIFLGLTIFIILWITKNYDIRKAGDLIYFRGLLSRKSVLNPEVDQGFLKMIAYNIYAFVFYAFPQALIGLQFSNRGIIAPLLSGVTFCGFLRCAIRKRTTVEYYFMFAMCALLIFPPTSVAGARYLIPFLPFIFYYFITGAKRILGMLESMPKKVSKNIFIGVISLLIVCNIIGTLKFGSAETETFSGDFLKMAEWAGENTSPETVFASYEPYLLYLYFHRESVVLPCAATDRAALYQFCYRNNVEYVIISSGRYKNALLYIKDLFSERPDGFTVVYREGNNIIYKVKHH